MFAHVSVKRNRMKRYDYVIFDFDGTVADTGEGILKSLQYAFLDQGDPVPDLSDLKKFINLRGLSTRKTFPASRRS